MKLLSKILLSSLVLTSFTLSACESSGWEEWNTPELFLSHSQVHHYVKVTSSEVEGEVLDYDFKIKNMILNVTSFESAKNVNKNTDKFIKYYILRSLSTAGPNYAQMFVYDTGGLQIDYKSALGKVKTFYYSFDSSVAKTLVENIKERVVEIQNEELEDENKANNDGNISNFLESLDPTKMIGIQTWKNHNPNGESHRTKDDGSVLALLKTIPFSPCESQPFTTLLHYNFDYGDVAYLKGWSFYMSSTLDRIDVHYNYKNRYDFENTVVISYTFDSQKGEEVYSLVLSLPSISI